MHAFFPLHLEFFYVLFLFVSFQHHPFLFSITLLYFVTTPITIPLWVFHLCISPCRVQTILFSCTVTNEQLLSVSLDQYGRRDMRLLSSLCIPVERQLIQTHVQEVPFSILFWLSQGANLCIPPLPLHTSRVPSHLTSPSTNILRHAKE